MSKSNATENNFLLLVYNATTWDGIAEDDTTSPVTDIYVALHTADPGDAGAQNTSETTYTSYARVAVARDNTGWTVTANSVSPAADITFPQCTGGTATITHFSTGVASSGATVILHSGTVTPNISVASGVTPVLTTDSTITED